jgi:gliding motility-associated-like protein
VANAFGCAATGSILISKDCYMDLPNAFTPNKDGVNDYFFPRQMLAAGLEQFRLQIFNRWGQLLFETSSPEGRGWDGGYNGQPQPAGVYVYQISLSFSNGTSEQYRGNVSLLR